MSVYVCVCAHNLHKLVEYWYVLYIVLYSLAQEHCYRMLTAQQKWTRDLKETTVCSTQFNARCVCNKFNIVVSSLCTMLRAYRFIVLQEFHRSSLSFWNMKKKNEREKMWQTIELLLYVHFIAGTYSVRTHTCAKYTQIPSHTESIWYACTRSVWYGTIIAINVIVNQCLNS